MYLDVVGLFSYFVAWITLDSLRNHQVRPSFDEINEQLDQIIVKSAIRDPHGRSFWIKHFLKQVGVSKYRLFFSFHTHTQDSVPWPQFAAAFYNFLRLPLIEDPNPTFDSGTRQCWKLPTKKKIAQSYVTWFLCDSDIIKYLYLDADLDGGVEDFEEGSKLQSDPKKKEQQEQANPVSEDVLKLRCLRYLLGIVVMVATNPSSVKGKKTINSDLLPNK